MTSQKVRDGSLTPRVPGTLVTPMTSGTTLGPLTLTGVTAASIPAGEHEGAVGIECESFHTPTSTTTFGSDNLTAVVLGA